MPIWSVMCSHVPGVPRAWMFHSRGRFSHACADHSANSSGELRVTATTRRTLFRLSASRATIRTAQASLSRLPEANP
uniref:Uncharacterized protein n=1 Tax=Salarias fasciatus TaxID=181472 RepID=A0A672IJM9_SALFA